MGQKVNPNGFRLGVSQKHISHWFIDNHHYSQLVVEDQFIRNFFSKRFPGIAEIDIKRDVNKIRIEILSANTRDLLIEGDKLTGKASLLPSKAGAVSSIDSLCNQLLKELTMYRNTSSSLSVGVGKKKPLKHEKAFRSGTNNNNTSSSADISTKDQSSSDSGVTELSPGIVESGAVGKPMPERSSGPWSKPGFVEVELFITKVENPSASAACLSEFIVEQLEKRVPFRRVLKRSIQKAEEASVEGIKVQISGRLNGAEIARSERIHKGQVPLHTLRAKIEYNSRTAKTIYGLLGVKVWVFNGFVDLNKQR